MRTADWFVRYWSGPLQYLAHGGITITGNNKASSPRSGGSAWLSTKDIRYVGKDWGGLGKEWRGVLLALGPTLQAKIGRAHV